MLYYKAIPLLTLVIYSVLCPSICLGNEKGIIPFLKAKAGNTPGAAIEYISRSMELKEYFVQGTDAKMVVAGPLPVYPIGDDILQQKTLKNRLYY